MTITEEFIQAKLARQTKSRTARIAVKLLSFVLYRAENGSIAAKALIEECDAIAVEEPK